MQNGFFLYEGQQVGNDSSHPHPHPQEIRLVYTVKKIDFFPHPQKAFKSVEMSKETKKQILRNLKRFFPWAHGPNLFRFRRICFFVSFDISTDLEAFDIYGTFLRGSGN